VNAVLAHGFGGLIEGSPSIGFAWRQPNASATTDTDGSDCQRHVASLPWLLHVNPGVGLPVLWL